MKNKGFSVPCKQGNQGDILLDKLFQLHRRERMLNLLCLAKKKKKIFAVIFAQNNRSNKNTNLLENHKAFKKFLHYHRTP